MAGNKTSQQLREDIERKEKTSGSTSVYAAVGMTVGVAGVLLSAPLAPVALVGAGVSGYLSDKNSKAAQQDRNELARRGAAQPPDYKKEGRVHAFEKYATHNWVKDASGSQN